MPTKEADIDDDASRRTVGSVDGASRLHETSSERELQGMDSQTLNAVISAAHSLYTVDETFDINRIWMDALASNGRDQRRVNMSFLSPLDLTLSFSLLLE